MRNEKEGTKQVKARRVVSDYRYRTVLFAVPGLILNIVFAVFNGFWSLMRFAAVRYERRGSGRERTKELAAEEIAAAINVVKAGKLK